MYNRTWISIALTVFIVMLLSVAGTRAQGNAPQGPAAVQDAVGTKFTYQGELEDGGSPANGTYDFSFTIYDQETGGSAIVGPLGYHDIPVTDGKFAVAIDVLGPDDVFEGFARWLGISVRPGDSTGAFTTLSPRQKLTPTPYAFSLWPGARITGENGASGATFNVWNNGIGSGQTAIMGWARDNAVNTTYGVTGMIDSTHGAGVQGLASATDGFGSGVRGESSADDGQGVYGRASSFTGVTEGVYGWSQSDEGRGVYGLASSDSGTTYGVYGESQSSAGVGVYGEGSTAFFGQGEGFGARMSADSTGTGVYSLGRTGVTGISFTGATGGFGGAFFNHNDGEPALYASGAGKGDQDLVLGGDADDDGTLFSDQDKAGSDLFMYSNDEFWIYLDYDGGEDGHFEIRNSAHTAVFMVDESGNYVATGTKSAAVETESQGTVKLYAMESPENWFEDFGAGQLAEGKAVVSIDALFAETVNLTEDYRVFVTPLGDCPLFVAEKTPASFTVQAMGGETCSISFDYRIVAKRLGYEDLRLDPVELGTEEE